MNLYVIQRGIFYTGYSGGGSGAPFPNCQTNSFRRAVRYDSMEVAIKDAIQFHSKVVDDSDTVLFDSER